MLDIHTMDYGSISAGPGYRVELFTQGCDANCPGCFSRETHAFDAGTLMTIDQIMEAISQWTDKEENRPYLTVCGGEPLAQVEGVIELCEAFKEKYGRLSHIIVYTGYELDEAKELPEWRRLRKTIDGLVVGRFIKKQRFKMTGRKFIGSSNQRYVDLRSGKDLIYAAEAANWVAEDKKLWPTLGISST